MSKLDKLIHLRKKYSGWDGAVTKILGIGYERSPAFRDHIFAYNTRTNPESMAKGYDRYLLRGELCLD